MMGRKILVPFRTTKDYHFRQSLLLVWQIYSSTGILTWTAFWGHYVSSFDGPVIKYSGKVLNSDQYIYQVSCKQSTLFSLVIFSSA